MTEPTVTTLGELTEQEIALIQKHRAERDRIKAVRAFYLKSLEIAWAWVQFEERTGQGLTFSTFLNEFDYQEEDCKRMYGAVQSILSTALSQANGNGDRS